MKKKIEEICKRLLRETSLEKTTLRSLRESIISELAADPDDPSIREQVTLVINEQLSGTVDHGLPESSKSEEPSTSKRRTVATTTKLSKKPSSSPERQLAQLKKYVFLCGIHKNWFAFLACVILCCRKRELEPLGGISERIKHVREILSQVGITGRPSKAACQSAKGRKEREEEFSVIKENAVLSQRLRSERKSRLVKRP